MRNETVKPGGHDARDVPGSAAPPKPGWSLRFQLLLAVNALLLVGLLTLLAMDYVREQRQRLHDRQVALREEANLLVPIISQLRDEGPERVQAFLNSACGRVQDATSPAHHLAARLGDEVLQAHAQGLASSTLLQAMQDADRDPKGREEVDGRLLLVGGAGSGDLRVWVSEYADEILAASRWRLLTRSLGMGVWGCS